MTKFSRTTLILSGVIIIALILLFGPRLANHGKLGPGLTASSNLEKHGVVGDATDSSGEPLMRSTKSDSIRPSAEELARKRIHNGRIELVRKLQTMRDGGLSDQHPSMRSILEKLAKDPDIRTLLEDDGTYVLWTRDTTKNGFQLIQYQFASGGTVSLKTVHRTNPEGSAMTSKIFDGRNNEIYKVSYGYRVSDGTLVEERVFDSRDKLLNDQGTEVPVQRVLHSVNPADGLIESNVVDSAPPNFPPQMKIGFKNPFLQQ